MNKKEKTIDQLLGALSPEEKAGQLLVFGLNGTIVDPDTEMLVDRCNIGGLRTSPYIRKFIRYLPDGAPGIQNVLRPPSFTEKHWDEHVEPPHLRASEYAGLLNRLRARALKRKHAIPLHFTIDYEGGGGSNFLCPGMLTLPSPMGFGHTGNPEWVRRSSYAIGRQLKAIGFDYVQSPVVDVNTNPDNPEISTRAYSADPTVVTRCARASLLGFKEAGMIATIKHFPGRGPSGQDAHFGITALNVDLKEFYRDHLAPYIALCKEQVVPGIMLAHSIYPLLDPSHEIATVSKRIVTGLLREELGFDGIITTDSMTMGGLMAKYSVGEAVIKAIDAGVDILLLKDDNSLRFEAYTEVVKAIKSGRLSEERVNQSLRRIWSAKWDYGLFKNGGIVKTDGLDEFMFRPEFQKVGDEVARRAIQLIRDRARLLPLRKDQKILVVDQHASNQLHTNDIWNHPGMIWEFLREHTSNVSYIDYTPKLIDKVNKDLEAIAPLADVLVVTASYDRNVHADPKKFIVGLKRFGKPVILISNNPYPLIVPEEIDTVICSYSLLRSGERAVSRYLFHPSARGRSKGG